MIHSMKIGDRRTFRRAITQADVQQFAEVTGDTNPTHLDAAYAATTRFKKPIVHGMLVGSLFSKVFGMDYPGEGTIYCSQTLTFLKPVYPDSPLTVEVIVRRLDVEKNRAYFDTLIHDRAGDVVIKGEAMVMPPKEKRNA